MPAIVNSVLEGSIAEELEITKGDEILSVDGCQMLDMIDYNFYMKSELITIEVKKSNGEIEEIEIEKDYDETSFSLKSKKAVSLETAFSTRRYYNEIHFLGY